ncbi:rhomboid family intramembrane serine protease [Prochlorothrix hollandica]|uniref:Peptidase S54 n=1 Tax=Prochlorothrix hollandica PCC 9006 = CALU 1027 TaxID=317619 RepID=A0A0M2Q2T6_PROHO|nr:rhomboid family intramembrane serine protease [Prochlorothrix hollandica]KKJ00902.1 peptidase S54 [Prochlorothrix hollandica PCC 9006 = CALU 1027]
MPKPNLLDRFSDQITILGSLVALMWAVEILDAVIFHGTLDNFGIRPRRLGGLGGILFSPFLHGDFAHLMANTVPFVTLGWLVMLRRIQDFWEVTIVTLMISGLGVWLLGASNSVHIGASGLIFGYFGFLLLRGYFERKLDSIALAIGVFAFYGGLLWGVVPWQQGISWEGHFFGLVGGGVAAWLLAKD